MNLIDINLMPWREKRQSQRGWCYVAMLIASLIAPLVVLTIGNKHLLHTIKIQMELNRKLSAILQQRQLVMQSQQKIQQQTALHQAQQRWYSMSQLRLQNVIQFLEKLSNKLPGNVVLASVLVRNEKMRVHGYARNTQELLLFVTKIMRMHVIKLQAHNGYSEFLSECIL